MAHLPADEDSRTPFKLVTSCGPSVIGSKLLYEGREVENVISVSVENIVNVDHGKRSRIVIEVYGETEVEQAT